MTNLESLLEAIRIPLVDTNITDDFIISKINQGLEACAEVVILPKLESSGTVITSPTANEVEIPVQWNYHKGMYYAKVASERSINVLSSVGILSQLHPNIGETPPIQGPIQSVTIRAGKFVYYPSPEVATTVACKFYRRILPLVNDADIPELPALSKELLENYALWKCWETIEDGLEQKKINTMYHKGLFDIALDSLDGMVIEGQSTIRPRVDSNWI